MGCNPTGDPLLGSVLYLFASLLHILAKTVGGVATVAYKDEDCGNKKQRDEVFKWSDHGFVFLMGLVK